MDAATAQKLIALAISIDKTIGAILDEVENISDDKNGRATSAQSRI